MNDAKLQKDVQNSLKAMPLSLEVVRTHTFPKRIVHVTNGAKKVQWEKRVKAFYVPVGKNESDRKRRHRKLTTYNRHTGGIINAPLHVFDRDNIVDVRPLSYKEQALIDAYGPVNIPVHTVKQSPITKRERSIHGAEKQSIDSHGPEIDEENGNDECMPLLPKGGNEVICKKMLPCASIDGIDYLHLYDDFGMQVPKKHIDLSGCCYDVNLPVLVFLAKEQVSSRLESLVIKNVAGITEPDASAVFSKCRWPRLSHLDISSCSFVGDDLLHVLAFHCPVLSELVCSHSSKITDRGVAFLAKHCLNMKKWRFRYCSNVSNFAVKQIVDRSAYSKSDFEALDVEGNTEVDDSGILYALRHAKHLKELCLGNKRSITDVAFADIRENGVQSLEIIKVSGCRINGSILSMIAPLTRLHTVDLSYCSSICDEHMDLFAKNRKLCARLMRVAFRRCDRITDIGLAPVLQHCQRLKSIDLGHCSQIGDKSVTALAEATVWLHTANFEGCKRLGGNSIQKLCHTNSFCLKLLVLGTGDRINSIGKNTFQNNLVQISDSKSIGSGIGELKLLSTLDLSGMFRLGNQVLAGLLSGPIALKHIYLSGCTGITSAAIRQLTSSCRELVTLNLSCLRSVTDDIFLPYFSKPSMKLQKLVLRNCEELTNDGVYAFSFCKNLTDIDISGCMQCTEEGVVHIAKHCELVESLGVRGINVTSRILQELKRRKRLHHVDFTKCMRIDAIVLQRYLDEGAWPLARLASRSHSVAGTEYFGLKPKQSLPYAKSMIRVLNFRLTAGKYAIKIQSLVRRSILAHSKVQARKREVIDQERLAALIIFKAREKAAIQIQCAWRMYIACRRVKRQRIQKYFEYRECCRKDEAARHIQSHWRGRKMRFALTLFFEKRREAAVEIQKVWVGYRSRKYMFPILNRKLEAVKTMQLFFRKVHARSICREKRLQNLAMINRRVQSATKFQKAYRTYRTRNILKFFRRQIQMKCATKIQLWYVIQTRRIAGKTERVVIRRRRYNASLVLQSCIRMFLARKKVLRKRVLHDQFIRETCAATQIQKVFRGFADRKFTTIMLQEWRERVAAAVVFQKHIRRYLATTHTKRLRQEAKTQEKQRLGLERMRHRVCLGVLQNTWNLIQIHSVEMAVLPRGLLIRKATRRWACRVIQKAYRRYIALQAFRAAVMWNRVQSALRIQSIVRMRFARQKTRKLKSLLVVACVILQRTYRDYRRRRLLLQLRSTVKALLRKERLKTKLLLLDQQQHKVAERAYVEYNYAAAVVVQRHRKHRVKHEQERKRHEERRREKEKLELEIQAKIVTARSRYNLEDELYARRNRRPLEYIRLQRRFKANLKKQHLPLAVHRSRKSFIEIIKSKVYKSRKGVRENGVNLEKKRGMLYSIFAHQTTSIGINGMSDFHMSVGDRETEAFENQQRVDASAKRPYFVRLGHDLTSEHVNCTGAVQPQKVILWGKFEVCPLHKQYTDMQVVKLLPSSVSRRDISKHKIRLLSQGVLIISHKRVPFEIHLRRRSEKTTGTQSTPIVGIVTSKKGNFAQDEEQRLASDGYEVLEVDLSQLIHDIDSQRKKTVDFVDIDLGCRIWVKRLSATSFQNNNKHLTSAKKTANALYVGPDESKEMLLSAVEFTGLADQHVAEFFRKFQEIRAYAAAVAHIEVEGGENSVFVDDIFLYMGEKRTMLSELVFQFLGFAVGLTIDAEKMDFAAFFTFVSKFCCFGKYDLIRFLFYQLTLHSPEKHLIYRAHLLPLIRMVRAQYPEAVNQQQVVKASEAFKLPSDKSVKFGQFAGLRGIGRPDVSLKDFMELDRRYKSLFQPLYKLHESFTEKFLGKHFWRAHKNAFHRARQMVSEDRAESFLEDSSDDDEHHKN